MLRRLALWDLQVCGGRATKGGVAGRVGVEWGGMGRGCCPECAACGLHVHGCVQAPVSARKSLHFPGLRWRPQAKELRVAFEDVSLRIPARGGVQQVGGTPEAAAARSASGLICNFVGEQLSGCMG